MQQQLRPIWKERPLSAWDDEGIRCLNELRIDETCHRNALRKRLLGSITFTYWQSLKKHAEDPKQHATVPRKKDELIEQAIARHLGLHEAQPGRWATGETFPAADKVLGALVLVLRKEIDEVGFPRNREVAWQATSRTIQFIREQDCGLDRREIGRQEFSCVRWFVRHPESDLFLGRERYSSRKAIYRDVLDQLRRIARRTEDDRERKIQTVADAERALDWWLIPCLLFRVGLLKSWEHLDDDAC